ncbi:hypothetical protein ABPG75_003176 [Micractinium tetrahymenae]
MQQELPGEEFLRRRLARAAAIPPDQRSPEVSAFVAAMQLPDQVATLLPLRADGTAALPLDSADTGRRQALGVLMTLQASYNCPIQLEAMDSRCILHCGVYHSALHVLAAVKDSTGSGTGGSSNSSSSGSGSVGDEAHLSRLLLALIGSTCKASTGQHMAAVQGFRQGFELLTAVEAPVRRGLQQLGQLQRSLLPEAGPLPTTTPPPLRRMCSSFALQAIQELCMCHAGTDALPAQSQQALLAQANEAVASLLELEPNSPQAYLRAGQALACLEQHQRSMDCLLRCFELGRQQGSNFYPAMAALLALNLATRLLSEAAKSRQPCAISLASAQAALAALSFAEPAMRRANRLLPLAWVADLNGMLAQSGSIYEAAHARLQQLQARQAGGRGGRPSRAEQALARRAAEAERAMRQAAQQEQEDAVQAAMRCDACGQTAAGLQRCARCRRVQYCSRACQLAHWPDHRAECRPAV